MALVRVIARCNVYGLEVGDLADVDDANDEIAALIEVGLLEAVPSRAPATPPEAG